MARRIVHEILYDTEKATWVSDVGSPTANKTDHSYWEGELFVTAKGNWFINGMGGPRSMFSQEVDGSSIGTSNIIPISKGETLRMLEQHKFWDVILEHFEIEEA